MILTVIRTLVACKLVWASLAKKNSIALKYGLKQRNRRVFGLSPQGETQSFYLFKFRGIKYHTID